MHGRELSSLVEEVLGKKESHFRERFLQESRVTDFEKGYISVPFVNQLIDTELLGLAADMIAYRIDREGKNPDKIVMIPNSGAAIATCVAERLKKPLVSGRKGLPVPGAWSSPIVVNEKVASFTTGEKSSFVFNELGSGDRVLLVDDVIAHGHTGQRVVQEFKRQGVEVVGLSVVFAKLFQPGVEAIKREGGVDPFYVVGIKSLTPKGSVELSPPAF